MSQPVDIDIAVAGASSPTGELLLELLQDRDFPRAGLHALEDASAAGTRLPLGNRDIAVESLDAFDFSSVKLAFFCGGAIQAAKHAARAAAAGCIVIDTSAQFRTDTAVPMVVPELNAAALATVRGGGIVAMPSAAGIALALALKPLHQAAGLRSVHAFLAQPVSDDGREAVEELAQQTRALLNFQELPKAVYPKQIAFNLLPPADDEAEAAPPRELRRLLGEGIATSVSASRAPVFYGLSLAVHIETTQPLSTERAWELLSTAPGLELPDEAEEGVPTAVTEASGQDAVFIGRLRQEPSKPQALSLWITMDNLRKGAALNAVQVGEVLVRDYL